MSPIIFEIYSQEEKKLLQRELKKHHQSELPKGKTHKFSRKVADIAARLFERGPRGVNIHQKRVGSGHVTVYQRYL